MTTSWMGINQRVTSFTSLPEACTYRNTILFKEILLRESCGQRKMPSYLAWASSQSVTIRLSAMLFESLLSIEWLSRALSPVNLMPSE
jgi:hypothetical protein